jgi:glutamate/aspartate transport system substrate-binding protein
MIKTISFAATAAVMVLSGAGAVAQQVDTLKKIADTGSITMGVREASGAMSYFLGGGEYTGFHVDVCKRVIADLQKQLGLKKLDVRYRLCRPAMA